MDIKKIDQQTLVDIYSIANKRKKTKADARKFRTQLKKAVDQALGKIAEELVYLVGYGDYLKIGYTCRPIKKRLYDLQVFCPETLVLYATIPGNEEMEKELHERFASHRLRGEWFRKEQEIIDCFSTMTATNAA